MDSQKFIFPAMLDSHVKRYLKVIPSHLLHVAPVPPQQHVSRSNRSKKNPTKHRTTHKRNRLPLSPEPGDRLIHPEDRLFPEDNTIPESWCESMIKKDDYGSLSLNELASIERKKLIQAGLNGMNADRVFRGLFVYSFGVYELLQDLCQHCEENSGRIVSATWSIYLKLLEQIPANHPHLLSSFIGADAKTDAERKLVEQQRIVMDMLATQRLLEQRSLTAREKQERAEDEHAITSASLGSASAKIVTKTIAAQGLKLQLQKLQNKNSVLEDRNKRLELSANQLPMLKANLKTLIKKNRQNELDIFDFKTNLEETTANLKKTKQKLVTQQFKMGVLTTTRNKLRTRLELTSSQLQHKNRAFVQERDVKLDLLKELRAKNSKIHTHDQQYNQLLLSLERTSMREENIRTEYKNVLNRYALDQKKRDQIMNDADAALNKEKALQQLIQSLEQEIIKEQHLVKEKNKKMQELELELIQEKNARSVTNIKLNEAHDALAHAASEIVHLKQDIKGHETDKTELRLAADLALQQKMEADESSMIAADASRRSRCRAEAADEERRRTAIDFKAIEDGLRTRIISSRKDVDELELKKMEMENNYIAEIDQLNQINSNMNIKNQNITGRLDQTIERAEKSENIVKFVMHGIRNVTEDCVVKRKNALANETKNKCYCLDKSMFDLENVQNKKAKNKKNKNKKNENLSEDNEKKEDEEDDQEINDHIEMLTDDTTNIAASLLNHVSQHLSAIHLSWTTASNKIISLKKEISSHQRASEQLSFFLETEQNKLQKKYNAQQKEFKDVQAALDCKIRELQNETASSLMLAVEAKRIQEVANLSLEEIHQLKLKEEKERQLIENQRTTGMNTMEEDKDSETLGRAKWLMDAASKADKQAMEAQEAIEAMKSIQPVTTDIGTQVEERSTVNAECQTLENFWNEKKMETKRNEQNEQDEPDGLNAQNERQQRTKEDNDRNDKETDNTIQIHVTLVEKPTLSINTNGKGNKDDNSTGRKNEIKNGLTKNLENNLHVEGPPAFVAAALCRAFARMDDPAMFNAMWSSRGGGWSFKTNTSSFITTTKGNASTSTANANPKKNRQISQEFRKWSIDDRGRG